MRRSRAHLPWPGKVLMRQSWAHLSWPGRILARCAVGGVLEEVAAAAVEPGAHKTGADSHEPASVAVGWCVPSHSPRTPAPVYVRRARPQDSASLHPSPHLGNVAPSFFMVNAVFASGIVLRTFRFASSRPLRCFSLGTSAPLILSSGMVVRDVALRTFRFAPSPHALRRGTSRLRPRVARVLRTILLTTMQMIQISQLSVSFDRSSVIVNVDNCDDIFSLLTCIKILK